MSVETLVIFGQLSSLLPFPCWKKSRTEIQNAHPIRCTRPFVAKKDPQCQTNALKSGLCAAPKSSIVGSDRVDLLDLIIVLQLYFDFLP